MFLADLLFLFLALTDVWVTTERLPMVGIEAELNHFARWAARKWGIPVGVTISVMVPTVVIVLVIHTLWILTFLIGLRTTLFAFQLKVLFDPGTKKVS